MADTAAVGALGAGDHACLTFSDQEERLDLVAAFVRGGLRAGQKVVCWTDSVSPDELTGELHGRSVRPGSALRRGQLRIAPATGSLLGDVPADAAGMVDALAHEMHVATREGYPGLRVTADMCWATRPFAAAEQLLEFETRVGELLAHGQLCLICQYDRGRFDAVTLAFAARAHPRTVAAQVYLEHPLLRICRQYSPPGVRIAGELDYRHKDVLELALAESVRIDRRMHLNLTALDYIDGACAGIVVAAARALPRSRRMTISCRRLVGTVLSLVGADDVAQLRVQRRHE
ncbi:MULTISPECIES: MEDS domain-containing protein [unclassified Solwaraspora]|uniref:MEDS domain-containing protein n=1 Tax=unclassified Solwaraspora TaxID=2627926 RepID=UPI00259B4F0A|nr:MEDS domain-containing protein [Solwaraspora sp. WMMA2056]WJK39124.1 MEDS domain-containing protein [Solwaraspora sp. WMMA2056]